MIANCDAELFDWLSEVLHPMSGAGGFLEAIAEAAFWADYENYPILRPALLTLAAKYPQYAEQGRKRREPETAGPGV